MISLATLLIPTLILLVAVAQDLRSRKVKNSLVIAMAVVAFAAAVVFDGWQSLPWSFLSFGTAFFLGLPLFIIGAVGGADVKVFMAFSVLISWDAVISVGVASIFWGGALGLARTLLAGQGRSLAANTWGLIRRQRKPAQLHFVPYTVALLFGWMTHLALTKPWGLL
jgi:prepilin peptidase CpaA